MLAKTLETSIGWTSIQYGYITGAFQAAYAIGLLGGGYLMDRLGTRKGYSLAVSVWSLAAIAHAAATSAFSFGVARSFLGLGEAANFPACIKTVAEWFPKKERALAAGIFNAGTNIGAVVAPLTVPWLAFTFGWQMAFVATGALGFVWLIFWLLLYHKPEAHPRISSAELAYIQSDPADPEGSVSWMRLLPRRETWAFILGKFLTDPVWWFYLFWLPKYLQEKFGLGLMQIVLPDADCVQRRQHWQRGRRLVVFQIDQGRDGHQFCAEDCDADRRAVHVAGAVCAVFHQFVAGCRADQPGDVGAPGMVGKFVYAGFGYVSAKSGGERGGNWRDRRSYRRSAHPDNDGLRGAEDALVYAAIYFRGSRVCGRAGYYSWTVA